VQDDGTAIIGVDDAWCAAAADRIASAGKRVVRVSARHPLRDGVYVEKEKITQAAGEIRAPVACLAGIGSLRGVHNAQNAACAAAAALALGLTAASIEKGLSSFPGLAHRMEQVGRKGRVLFVNDSKATNADSAAQALACFSGIYWIAGGKPKSGGIASLAPFFPRMCKAYLIGEAAADFAGQIEGKVPYVIAGSLDRAVDLAAHDAEASNAEEPVVLLSPACASFDQYANFEERGRHFAALALEMSGNGKRKTGNEESASRDAAFPHWCPSAVYPSTVFRLSFLSCGGRSGRLDICQAQLVKDPGEKIRFLEGNVPARFQLEHGEPVDHLAGNHRVPAPDSRRIGKQPERRVRRRRQRSHERREIASGLPGLGRLLVSRRLSRRRGRGRRLGPRRGRFGGRGGSRFRLRGGSRRLFRLVVGTKLPVRSKHPPVHDTDRFFFVAGHGLSYRGRFRRRLDFNPARSAASSPRI
jgi:hypothetical protein